MELGQVVNVARAEAPNDLPLPRQTVVDFDHLPGWCFQVRRSSSQPRLLDLLRELQSYLGSSRTLLSALVVE